VTKPTESNPAQHPSDVTAYVVLDPLHYEDASIRRIRRSTDLVLVGAKGERYRMQKRLWSDEYDDTERLRLVRSEPSARVWVRNGSTTICFFQDSCGHQLVSSLPLSPQTLR